MSVRSKGFFRRDFGRLPKLSPTRRLLAFILHLKHDNSAMMEAFTWNWATCSVSDHAIFVERCISHGMVDEIRWSIERCKGKTSLRASSSFHALLVSSMGPCARFGDRSTVLDNDHGLMVERRIMT